MLMPRLVRLATEFGGRFRLVMLNTDELGRLAQADDLLRSLPSALRQQPEVRDFSAHVSFVRTARESPPVETLEQAIAGNPNDLDARYSLSAKRLTLNDFEGAMDQLLEIIRRDDGFRDRAGRDGLLAIFAMLGEEDERVQRYRALLQQTAH